MANDFKLGNSLNMSANYNFSLNMMISEKKPADWDCKNILLNAKIYNVRCTQGKDPNLKSVSNMGYLLKVIQEKNSRNKNLLLMPL
jgi:hypothetical protein